MIVVYPKLSIFEKSLNVTMVPRITPTFLTNKLVASTTQILKFSTEIKMKTYVCIVCGLVYDEAAGMPSEGIPAGTLWADVPADWLCPDCGVAKSDFEMVEV
jgi:rubredoxin